ncbi:MAG: putative dTDP-glucose pyrophosphorylase [uncultured bacterium]|nr:MAG: putative dTDP-glucose pyrophosphorylase [uncultured bacterium]
MMKNVQVGVVLAGGKGTRLGWLGKFLPKSLVPIGQKPMLYYIIKNLKSMKITKIYLLVNYKKNLIKRYLAEEPEFKEIDFYYIHSQPNLGLAQVIQKTERFIKEPFVVFLGDDFTICPKISQFPKKGLQKGIVAQEAVIRENDAKILSQTCEVFFDKEGKILKASEKPQKPTSKYRGCGLYFFRPQVFDYIRKTPNSKKTGKREITDTINLIAQDGKAFAWPLDGVNVNINTQADLVKAIKCLFANG